MAVSRRLRFEILRRDGHSCRYCGAGAPEVVLHVDHVIPTTLGGGDEPNNLVTACADCNNGKSSIAPDSEIVEDVDATALLMKGAMERAAEMRREDQSAMESDVDYFDDHWRQFRNDATGKVAPRPGSWRTSVRRFMENGLDVDDLELLVNRAMDQDWAADKFTYMCKLAWAEIRERQELARTLIEDGEV